MNHFKEKLNQLESARTQLKTEFFGIDHCIDQLIEFSTPWFCLEYYQKSPTVIPLIGMTGVGKTSLIERFVELMDSSSRYFHFDIKDIDGSWELNERLGQIHREYTGKPFILCLDEFQFAGRKGDSPFGAAREEFKNVWKLLDDGKLVLRENFWNSEHDFLLNFINDLRHLIKQSVRAENGVVYKGVSLFNDLMYKRSKNAIHGDDSFIDDDTSNPKLVPSRVRSTVFECLKSEYKDHFELIDYFDSLDEIQTLEFLKKVYLGSIKPKELDASRSLIFVVANLDKAYEMHSSLDPDIDADSFYKSSLGIDLLQIKLCLQDQFRDEQVARLGNSMIIYPSLNKQAFLSIIERELEAIQMYWAEFSPISLRFDDSFVNLIYDQGVYPSQGARPLLSTIEQIAWNFVTKLIVQITEEVETTPIRILHENEKLVAIWDEGDAVLIAEQTYENRHKTLKQRIGSDAHALIAVHEAGHAIVSITLRDHFPDRIFSMSGSHERLGAVMYDSDDALTIDSYHETISRMAVEFGGFIAEKLVFGVENTTLGNIGDLKSATSRAQALIRDNGFGKYKAAFYEGNPEETFKLKTSEETNGEIIKLLELAETKAKEAIELNFDLFMELSRYLAKERIIEKAALIEMAERIGYRSLKVKFSYRDTLFEQDELNTESKRRAELLKGNTENDDSSVVSEQKNNDSVPF